MNKIFDWIKRRISTVSPESAPQSIFTKDYFAQNDYDIGEYTYGKPEVFDWGEGAKLKIGKFCSIANNVKIFLGGNHRVDWKTTYPFSALLEYFPEAEGIAGHPATKGDVIIGNDVWIGHSVIILSGVQIADGAVIGAGSVIAKDVGPYEIWTGNPAVFRKKRFSQEVIDQLLKEQWWNLPSHEIREKINDLCSKP